MTERKQTSKQVGDFDVDYSTFEELRMQMAEIEKRHPEYDSFSVQKVPSRYGDYEEIKVYGLRMETDDEMNLRIAEEDKANRDREDRERREFDRLMQKFGHQQ